ncbi:MAG: TetR family transcriptional regulator [Succinivibrio sp.]|nr:TetR family transcriptional regulator [Succinivibrio sp.]
MARSTPKQAEQTRKLILKTALKLFAKQGYDETSLSDIATAAGITRGAIYWHFKDKIDLLDKLCVSLDLNQKLSLKLLKAGNPKEEDPLGKLRAFLLAHAEHNNREFFSSAMFTLIERILMTEPQNPNYTGLYKICQLHKENICNALRNAVNKKQLPEDLLIDLAADQIGIFIGGLIQLIHLNMTDRVFTHFDKLVDATLQSLHYITAGDTAPSSDQKHGKQTA